MCFISFVIGATSMFVFLALCSWIGGLWRSRQLDKYWEDFYSKCTASTEVEMKKAMEERKNRND